jgi:hypothetical protein
MRLTKYEMETTINWNLGDDTAYISTRMPAVIRHMEKVLGIKPTTTHRDSGGRIYGKDYEIPKKFVRLPRRTRQVSEEQRKKMAERLAEIRERSKS